MSPDQQLSLAYARADVRAALTALFRFDARLGGIVKAGGEPTLIRIKLAWWREVLEGKTTSRDPDMLELQRLVPAPLLIQLAPVADGWSALLESDMGITDALQAHGADRGEALFVVVAGLYGVTPSEQIRRAGFAWAIADSAFDPVALELVRDACGAEDVRALTRQALPLAILARLALGDAAQGRRAGPLRRMARALRLALLRW